MSTTNGSLTRLKKIGIIVSIVIGIMGATITVSTLIKANADETYSLKYFDKSKGEKLEVEVNGLKTHLDTYFADQNKVISDMNKVISDMNKVLTAIQIQNGVILEKLDE